MNSPVEQFTIKTIYELNFLGIDVSFTNASLFMMLSVLGSVCFLYIVYTIDFFLTPILQVNSRTLRWTFFTPGTPGHYNLKGVTRAELYSHFFIVFLANAESRALQFRHVANNSLEDASMCPTWTHRRFSSSRTVMPSCTIMSRELSHQIVVRPEEYRNGQNIRFKFYCNRLCRMIFPLASFLEIYSQN